MKQFTVGVKLISVLLRIVLAAIFSVSLCNYLLKFLSDAADYKYFISGNIAWTASSKGQDYFSLIGIFTLFLVFWKLNSIFFSFCDRRYQNWFIWNLKLLAIPTIPFLIWLGSLIHGPGFINEYLYISLAAAVLSLLLSVIGTSKIRAFQGRRSYERAILGSWSFILLSIFSCTGLATVLGHLNVSSVLTTPTGIYGLIITIVALAIAYYSVSWVGSDSTDHLQVKIFQALCLSQIFVPLNFLNLLPLNWTYRGEVIEGYDIGLSLKIVTSFLIFISYISLYRILRNLKKDFNPVVIRLTTWVSPMTFIAILFFLKGPLMSIGILPMDDYHSGEFYLPWWTLKEFGYIPFWDYVPARGLLNYLPGAIADLFFPNSLPAYLAPNQIPIYSLIFIGITWVGIASLTNRFFAFYLMLLSPPITGGHFGLWEIYLVLTVCLCLSAGILARHSYTQWLIFFLILIPLIFLFAPAQGMIFIIANLPLAGIAISSHLILKKNFSIRLSKWFLLLLAGLLGITFLKIPLYKMFYGAGRYLTEMAPINTVAFGIPWAQGFGYEPDWISFPLWQILQASWLVVGIIASLVVIEKVWPHYRRHKRLKFYQRRLLAIALPIALMAFLWIPRAAGRIEAGALGRFIISPWFLGLLLPILLALLPGKLYRYLKYAIPALCGGIWLVFLGFENLIFGYEQPFLKFQNPVYRISQAGVSNIDISAGVDFIEHDTDIFGGSKIPVATVDLEEQLKRFEKLRRIHELMQVLEIEKGHLLDLTNRSSQYFYLDTPPPIEASIYNLPHPAQQMRALERALNLQVPIVFLGDSEIPGLTHDGGKISLRNPLLYRYFLLNYQPTKIDGTFFLVDPAYYQRIYEKRLLLSSEKPLSLSEPKSPEESISWLDEVFYQNNLYALPYAWGKSYETLKTESDFIAEISTNYLMSSNSLQISSREESLITATVTGEDAYWLFDISSLGIAGIGAGLLAFDLHCIDAEGQVYAAPSFFGAEVYWSTPTSAGLNAEMFFRFDGNSGRYLIPLDSAPRWLLADSIELLRIDFTPGTSGCQIVRLANIELRQRKLPGILE